MTLFTLLAILYLFFQPADIDPVKLQWSETRKLTWADFQGIPNGADDFVASTNSGISFSYSISNKNGDIGFKYIILSNFYPEQSWYKPEAASEYILIHEQTHFDISELFARKLRKELDEILIGPDIKQIADKLYSEIEQQRRAMQLKYDAESNHSKNREGEFYWRAYIADELENYAGWK